MDKPTKITFAELRELGVRGVLIYCADYQCSHSIAVMADQWADDLRLSDIDDRFKARPGLRANPYAAGKAEKLSLLRDHHPVPPANRGGAGQGLQEPAHHDGCRESRDAGARSASIQAAGRANAQAAAPRHSTRLAPRLRLRGACSSSQCCCSRSWRARPSARPSQAAHRPTSD